jgi:hypothetical protein
MTQDSFPYRQIRRVPLALLALCAAAMTGCGGGDITEDAAMQAQVSSASPTALAETDAPAQVRLEGCLVDHYELPATAGTVHALTADGRLVGTARSDANGVFTMRVPARASIVLKTHFDERSSLTVLTGNGSLFVGACLQVPRA